MRVLLVNANQYKDPMPVMPLGLCSVASSLESAGHTVRVLDLCFTLNTAGAIRTEVERFSPELVGVGVRNIDNSAGNQPVFFLDDTRRAVFEPLKAVFPGPVVLGGAPAGINAAECLALFDIEYAVQGDGEHAMVELARRLSEGGDPRGIPGLVIRRGGAIVEANPPDHFPDLDALPWARPHRHLDLGLYQLYRTPFQVQTKRGCALGCTYCTYNRLEGTSYRLRSPKLVADEVEEFVRETHIRHVEIVDSTFNVPLDHAKAVLRELISRKLGLRVSTMGLNPRYVDEEFVGLMKQVGFMEACFGVEAGTPAMLAALGKNFGLEHIEEAARLIRKTRIPTSWFLLLGAPGETLETARETLDALRRIAGWLDFVNIGVGIRVYNGAPLAEAWAREHGGPPPDAFLRPVALTPEVELARLKALVEHAVARNHNFFAYERRADVPLPFRVVFNLLFRKQPIWRSYVFFRFLEKVTGLFLFRVLAVRLRVGALELPAPLQGARRAE